MSHYFTLMRFHKPIGILLLLWPTLWAICLASSGRPQWDVVIIFIAGVIIMRSAGCVINDIADRHFDAHVERTRERPLASGKIKTKEALILFGVLMLFAFLLVLLCNWLTIKLAFMGALLASVYPYLKRITHLPQLGLGVAFAWSVPMAFAAQTGEVSSASWVLFAAAVVWPVMYDTEYAMADREDDRKIGIKSTAILFGSCDRLIIAILQLIFLGILIFLGKIFHVALIYYAGLFIAGLMFVYQQFLMSSLKPEKYFAAFLNNNWVGMVIFIGILLSYF